MCLVAVKVVIEARYLFPHSKYILFIKVLIINSKYQFVNNWSIIG